MLRSSALLRISILAVFFSLFGCVYDAGRGGYRDSGRIEDLLGQPTLQWYRMGEVSTKEFFYDSDGHGVFDTLTVIVELPLFAVGAIPGAALAWTGFLMVGGYGTIRGQSMEQPVGWDLLPMTFLYFIPVAAGAICIGIGSAFVQIYDVLFHDIPVLMTKGIAYPFQRHQTAAGEGSTSTTLQKTGPEKTSSLEL